MSRDNAGLTALVVALLVLIPTFTLEDIPVFMLLSGVFGTAGYLLIAVIALILLEELQRR